MTEDEERVVRVAVDGLQEIAERCTDRARESRDPRDADIAAIAQAAAYLIRVALLQADVSKKALAAITDISNRIEAK